MAGNLGEASPSYTYQIERKGLDLNKYVKYFLHGLGFNAIMFVVALGWVFLLLGLAICGLCFGIAIAIGILLYVMGWVNIWLMRAIWGREKTDQEWWWPFIHGGLLFIVLIVLHLPWYGVQVVIPEINTWPLVMISVVIFFIYCFIDGIAAYYVGSMFMESFKKSPPPAPQYGTFPPVPPAEPQGPSPPGP